MIAMTTSNSTSVNPLFAVNFDADVASIPAIAFLRMHRSREIGLPRKGPLAASCDERPTAECRQIVAAPCEGSVKTGFRIGVEFVRTDQRNFPFPEWVLCEGSDFSGYGATKSPMGRRFVLGRIRSSGSEGLCGRSE